MQNRLDIPRLDSPVRCQPLQSFLCTPATKNPPDESRKIRRSRKVPTFRTKNALQEYIYIYLNINQRISVSLEIIDRSLQMCNYLSTAMTQASRTRPALNPSSSTVNNFKKRLVARITFPLHFLILLPISFLLFSPTVTTSTRLCLNLWNQNLICLILS